MKMKIVNIEAGMPTVKEATVRLSLALRQAKAAGFATVKIIHGYGSSGTGGSLRDAIRASLRKRRKEGKISTFVTGEQWSPFDDTARTILQACPTLERDPDLGRYNEGITIVLL